MPHPQRSVFLSCETLEVALLRLAGYLFTAQYVTHKVVQDKRHMIIMFISTTLTYDQISEKAKRRRK